MSTQSSPLRKTSRLAVVVGLLAVIVLSTGALAKVFVSLNGGFYIEYPDQWWQVDYQTVDYYLQQLQADPDTYDYDAVFSARKLAPFHDYEYLIVTVDTSGEMDRRARDSVVAELADLFGEEVQYRPIQESFAALEVDRPAYDRDRMLFIRLTDVGDEQQGFKKHLYCLRFYEKGTAHFYFFAPDSTFDEYRPQFYDILMSFSTEDVAQRMPRESVKLADPEHLQKRDGASGVSKTTVVIPTAAVVIIIIALAARRKRRNQHEKE